MSGMIPVAGKGNKVLILKLSSTIEAAIAAYLANQKDIALWDECGYLAAVTPPSLTKEVNSENYLNSDDGFAKKSAGTKDAGDFTFQLGYAPGRTEQQRLVSLFDVADGEKEKTWYAVQSPTEDPEKPVLNMYYGILSNLGTPNSVENGADMKRDVTISLEGRPKLAEDLLRQLAAVPE